MGQTNSAEARATLNRDDSAQIARLNQHATDLFTRYKQLKEIDDLNNAILLGRRALSLCPRGRPDRWQLVNNLAVRLSSRYNHLGRADDLNEVIVLDREALSLSPPGHSRHSNSLNILAAHLFSRYGQLGGIDDLDEAIDLGRAALSLHPPGHPHCSQILNNLAIDLNSRYEQLGGINDLNEAIARNCEALSLRPPGHPDRLDSLNNFAIALFFRYNQFGGINDLHEAIVLNHEVLSLRKPGHPDRSASLNNLAIALSSRYTELGGIDDLNEAIVLDYEALSLRPPGHPGRSNSLNNLAFALSSRNDQFGGINDLNEAIVFDREALSLCPPGHSKRSVTLSNLAVRLFSRYDKLRSIVDLNEAILLDREALSLRPLRHPDRSKSLNNLALRLFSRYEELGGINDLSDAIVLDREALSLRPPGHPSRSESLKNLAGYLYFRREWFRKMDDHNAALEDKRELFALFAELLRVTDAPSSHDLTAARVWVDTAEMFHHPTTIIAYETALRLLIEYTASLPPLPQNLAILRSISSSLGVDAFSACLRNKSATKAVELLEQGRAVFWAQLTRLRSPLDDVVASGPEGKALANEFRRLTSLIRMTLHSLDADQHDRVCRFNLELKNVVSKIRELPNQSRFLLPLLFSDLQHAAAGGPVIIVNASKYGCDAVVVFADKNPVHIPLPVTKADVQKLSSKLRQLTWLSKRMDALSVSRGFKFFLRDLWDDVVSHIVNVLHTICPPRSRIWWCPTADFSFLPLHAAAPYGKHQMGVSDLYISSYTITLTALIHTRRPTSSVSATGGTHFIAIGQAQATGSDKLPSVGTELADIRELVDGLATFTCIEGQDSCVANVVDKLGENEWVHLACHGIPNEGQPFESAFALYDERLTVQRIIQCDLRNSEFAYLSACCTTVGDKECPDENIHLASAMQFAGFRSVIGTMWAVDDAETNKVTSMFYKFMKDESGRLDYTRAAQALRMTLRKVDIPMDQRILYIHLGA